MKTIYEFLSSGLFPVNMDNHDLHYFCVPLGGGDHAYSAMNLHDEWQKLKNWLVDSLLIVINS